MLFIQHSKSPLCKALVHSLPYLTLLHFIYLLLLVIYSFFSSFLLSMLILALYFISCLSARPGLLHLTPGMQQFPQLSLRYLSFLKHYLVKIHLTPISFVVACVHMCACLCACVCVWY